MLEFLIDFGFSEQQITALLKNLILFSAATAAVWLAMYFLQALATFKMSQKLGLKGPFFAFIPILRQFNMGQIAEKYRKDEDKKPARLSVYLLLLSASTLLLSICFIFFSVAAAVEIYGFAVIALGNGTEMLPEQFVSLVPVILLYILLFLFALAEKIVYYIALYRVFSLFGGKNAVLYTVLSVIFGFTAPIFLFLLKSSEPAFYKEPPQFSGSFEG